MVPILMPIWQKQNRSKAVLNSAILATTEMYGISSLQPLEGAVI